MATNVTLKKARDIARAALEAANQIKPETSVRFSIHSTREPAVVMSEAAGVFESAIQQADDLLEAYYKLRTLIGSKNDSCGVSDCLTKRAALDAKEKRLKALLEAMQADTEADSDLDVIKAKIEVNREARLTANRYSWEDTLTLKIATPEQIERITSALTRVRRERSDLQDKIAGLNLSETIPVPAAILETLQRVGIMD